MNRRQFLATTGLAGTATMLTRTLSAAEAAAPSPYLELRQYLFTDADQREAFHRFMGEIAIAACNRLKIHPVGVFESKEGEVYALFPHPTLESAVSLNQRLLADQRVTTQGADFLNAPKTSLPFAEERCWLMKSFKGMPQVEIPSKAPGRVFQLRIYSSPSPQTGQKKIEMFNDAGELKIFREVGLNPVFFGETLFGAAMPNLTYMLGFDSDKAQKEAWGRFGKHPEWQRLRKMDEFADGRIIRGIQNIPLKPTSYSQI